MDKPPIDFDGPEPEPPYDVNLSITEMIDVVLFVCALLATGFVIGRMTV